MTFGHVVRFQNLEEGLGTAARCDVSLDVQTGAVFCEPRRADFVVGAYHLNVQV